MSESSGKRVWTVGAHPDLNLDPANGPVRVYEADRQAVVEALAELETIGHRIGGFLKAQPIRVETEIGHVTVAWAVQWEKFNPSLRPQERATEPVEEPVLAVDIDIEQVTAEEPDVIPDYEAVDSDVDEETKRQLDELVAAGAAQAGVDDGSGI